MSNLTVSTKENWVAIKEQAEAVKKAGLLPANLTAEQATIIILKGQEIGIGAMRALEGLFVVNGKIGMSAALVAGLIRERCPKAELKVIKKDDQGCTIQATRPGQQPETFSFTMKDAQAAGLVKPGGPWTKYPSSMCWSRCITNIGRQLFSDILGAPYTSEELGGEAEEIQVRQDQVREWNGSEDKQGLLPSGHQRSDGKIQGNLQERIAAARGINAQESIKAEEVIKETGEVIEPKLNESEPLPSFDDFDKWPEKGNVKEEAKHWLSISKAGSYEGQTFKEIYDQLGKEKFFALYQASVKSIGKMQAEGKAISETTQQTFKDLEACMKDLGL
jgi:hypothetical protein